MSLQPAPGLTLCLVRTHTSRLQLWSQREERRVLGLVILRGEEIVSLVLEGPPPAEEQQPIHGKPGASGAGVARAAGRGVAMTPGAAAAGLAGPVRGVGGPAPGMMLPQPQVRGLMSASHSVTTAVVAFNCGRCAHQRLCHQVHLFCFCAQQPAGKVRADLQEFPTARSGIVHLLDLELSP
jgi:hypothetical protein